VLETHGIYVKNIGIEKDIENNRIEIAILGNFPEAIRLDEILGELQKLQGVSKLKVDSE
jgi:hypothetical protein